MLDFLQSPQESSNDRNSEHVAVTQYKASIQKHPAVVDGFCYTNDAALCEFVTMQICQVLQTCITASFYVSNDARIIELVSFLFCYRMLAVILMNCGSFLQLTLESYPRKTESRSLTVTITTTFAVIVSSIGHRYSTTGYIRRRRGCLKTTAQVR